MVTICWMTIGMRSVFLFLLSFCIQARGQLTSYRVETPGMLVSTSDSGQSTIYAEEDVVLRLYFLPNVSTLQPEISFTSVPAARGFECTENRLLVYKSISSVENSKQYKITLFQRDGVLNIPLMFCVRMKPEGVWIHQGSIDLLQLFVVLRTSDEYFPLWLKCFLIPVFVIISAIACSFLSTYFNLSKSELKLLKNSGKSDDRYFAKAVYPLRKKGNFVFCSILCCKVICDVLISIILYSLIGLYSILAAALTNIIFCNYIPIILSTKYGLLTYGLSNMVCLTNIYCILTFYLSYILGKLLDVIFKNDIPYLIDRDQLMVCKNTETINSGANDRKSAEASEKSVADIMVRLSDAYMEEYNTTLTSETLGRIRQIGFSCIPIYETEKQNIVAVLHVKDLVLINQVDSVSVKTLCKYYNRPINFVFEDTKLNVMLEEFKKGQSSIAFVQHINNEGSGDPFYETLGFVTLKDVIDHIFSLNTVSLPFKERDVNDWNRLPLYSELRDFDGTKRVLPINLSLAAQHFLSSSVSPFNQKLIAENVLERLISQTCNFVAYDTKSQPLIEKGKPCNSFILVLEGYVQVYIGAENFAFDSGPFSHFALKTLPSVSTCPPEYSANDALEDTNASDNYTPDFSVYASTDLIFLRISRAMYMMALRTSLLTFPGNALATPTPICSDTETEMILDNLGKSAASPMDSVSDNFCPTRPSSPHLLTLSN